MSCPTMKIFINPWDPFSCLRDTWRPLSVLKLLSLTLLPPNIKLAHHKQWVDTPQCNETSTRGVYQPLTKEAEHQSVHTFLKQDYLIMLDFTTFCCAIQQGICGTASFKKEEVPELNSLPELNNLSQHT